MDEPHSSVSAGLIKAIAPDSLANKLGVHPGDYLLAVNGEPVDDVIDVQYYAAEYSVDLRVQRGEETLNLRGERQEMQPLGLEFAHPTFDTDIRRCNNLCQFCFVLQMAPQARRTLYIKDDDYRYSFLFGHFVTLTNLSKHDEWRIVEQGLSPLYVSVHATDDELRRRCLGNLGAPEIVPQLTWLVNEGIEVHTQIVVVPGLNDGAHLERSVLELAALYPGVRSVSVVPVGLTKHHKYGMRPNTSEEAGVILDACDAWRAEYRNRWGVHFVYPTDEWYLLTGRPIPPIEAYDGLDLYENGLGVVRRFMDEWNEVQDEIDGHPMVKGLTLVTAPLFAPILAGCAAEFSRKSGVDTQVVPIANTRLGTTITVAGLLMGKDVIAQLGGEALGEVVVLPRIMFDHPEGISLDDQSPMDVAQALGKPVALADLISDLLDIASGNAALYFDPSDKQPASQDSIQKEGGWSLEKYL